MLHMLIVVIIAGLVADSEQRVAELTEASILSGTDTGLVAPQRAECWTDWFDRDDPSGSGDWETLLALKERYPRKICSKPSDIEVETLTGLSFSDTGDVIFINDPASGFVCRNQDQTHTKRCSDYRVRFRCFPPFCGVRVCWTPWYNRDHPSGSGDWELLNNLRQQYPGQICAKPLDIEVVTVDTLTPASSTGENFLVNTPARGFACRNRDQKDKRCRNYKVRFGCPCK